MSTAGESASNKYRPIEIFNRQRKHRIDRCDVAYLARSTLNRIGRSEATITITFIRDRRMRELNRQFRNIDAPTDVLSFAYHEGMSDDDPLFDPNHLGDVVISVETAARYAQKLGLDFAREIAHLVIHGVLHLAGYDHETDHGEMKRLELRLRRELIDRRSR